MGSRAINAESSTARTWTLIVKRGMSTKGRVLRIIGGLKLTTLAILGVATPWTWIGIVPLVTGAVGWCPFPILRARLMKG